MSAYNVNIHEIRPRLPGSPGGSSVDDPHLKRRRLSVKQEETRLNFLKILFFFLLLTSAAVELFCWYVWMQTNSSVLIGIAVTCIFTMMGSILGLIGAFQGIGDLHASHSMLESGDKKTTPGEDILLYSFYFLICVFTAHLVFGSAALFFQEQPLSYLAAKNVSDEEGWQALYEGKTLEEVQGFTVLMVSIAGYACYLMSLIITLIFYFIFLLSTDYEAIQTVLQVINYALLLLGLAIIYLASYCLRYRDQMDFTNMSPPWVTSGILLCGFVLIFLAYYGFYAAFTEKDSFRKLYVVFAVVLMFICAIFSVASVKQGREFREELSENCLDIMQKIDSVYMEGLGCKNKYTSQNILDDQLNCTKSTIAYIWEDSFVNNETIKSHSFGCLNEQCCDTLVRASKSIFDYLGIFAASAIALSAVAIWGGLYLHEKIVRIGRSEMNKAGYKILTMMILSTLLTIVIIVIGVPVGPRLPPHTGGVDVVDRAGFVDPKYMGAKSCYKLNATEFTDAVKKAEEFKNDEIIVEIKSYNGQLYHIKNDNSKETANQIIRVKTKELSNMISYIKSLQFCITCPQEDAYLTLSASLLTVSTNTTSPYYNFRISYDVSSDQAQTFTGHVVSSPGRLSGVTIEGAMDSCYFTSSRSDSKGEYSLSAPLSSDLSPYYLTVQYYSPYHSKVNRKLQVGGLPLTNIYLPPTYLPLSTQQGNGNVHVRVYDVITNTQIEAQVLFRTGYNNFTGPYEKSYNIAKNATLSLDPGVYSVVASANKYKLDTAEVVVNSNQNAILSMLLPRDDIDEDAIRVVLGWKSQNLDLDLHVTFKLDEKYDCDVSYAYKHCGGAKIQSTNIHGGYNGGEVIDLYEVGNTTYLFYVKDFRKDSPDLPVENQRLNILQSEAEVKVYTANYDEPVLRLQVPDEYPWPDSDPTEFRVWLAFCMKGAQGLESLSPVKAFLPVSETPILYSNICS